MGFLQLTFVWLATAFGGAPNGVWVEREALALGLPLYVSVEADSREAADRVVDDVLSSVAALEARLATWRPDSELSRLNRAPIGEARPVSGPLFGLLSDAWRLSAATNRAFDPGIGALLDAWARDPLADGPGPPLSSSGRGCFDLRPATRSISRDCEGASMDSRGFARGAALTAAAEALRDAGARSARLELGGQYVVRGTASRAVDLGDPAEPTRAAFRLTLEAGTLASAGAAGRGANGPGPGVWPHLDPRSGRPVAAWGSVWVRSVDPLAADMLSSALYVMGPDAATRWLVARPEVEAILIVDTDDGPVACGAVDGVAGLTTISARARTSERYVSDGVLACPVPEGSPARPAVDVSEPGERSDG